MTIWAQSTGNKMGKLEAYVGADAQVDLKRGVVICHADYPFIGEGEANDLAVSLFGTESFHNGDYALCFDNIKQNVKTRIDSYLEKMESKP